jgi:signal transduction histidine kinase
LRAVLGSGRRRGSDRASTPVAPAGSGRFSRAAGASNLERRTASGDILVAHLPRVRGPVPAGAARFRRPVRSAAPHPWAIAGIALCLGVAALAVVLLSPVRFAYPASSVGIALETGIALSALLSAYLLLGRFGAGVRLDHLYMGAALATLAATNLLLVTVYGVEESTPPRVPLYTGALAGAALLALAALVPSRGPRSVRRTAAGVLATWAVVLAGSYAVAQLTVGAPQPLLDMTELDGSRAYLERPPGVLLLPLAGTALFGLAALGFARRSTRSNDELLLWLAPGAVCIALAGVGYFLFPPAPAGWVHVGDVFRALFCMVVLVGVARWVRGYWRDLAATAVAAERRRIARELHDGVTQELALIQRRAPGLALRSGAGEAGEIIAATERAMDESRRAIDVLSRPRDEPLDRALAREARHVTAGSGAALSLHLARGLEVQPHVQENLVRIAREAMVNAARHARAGTIRVELAAGHPLRMRVVDDGVGFEPARAAPRDAFGLVSMRERAVAIGADLTLRSRPGRGTEVLVRLP